MTYWVINDIVVQIDSELTAAQAHGMATGMLCANTEAECSKWLTELFQSTPSTIDADRSTLENLFDETQHLLASDEFEFDLLLPGDEALLSEQIEALSNWCQGFLFGVAYTHSVSDYSRDVTEILKDIVEFTKLSADAEGEQDENDFMEITEYMRSAVLLLRSELNDKDNKLKN
jgi:uncharacterized protein YgfB (UPF0149 family)